MMIDLDAHIIKLYKTRKADLTPTDGYNIDNYKSMLLIDNNSHEAFVRVCHVDNNQVGSGHRFVDIYNPQFDEKCRYSLRDLREMARIIIDGLNNPEQALHENELSNGKAFIVWKS